MKKKFKQLSKTSLSLVLSVLMLVSSVVVGNSETITDQMLTGETSAQVEAAENTQADDNTSEANEEAKATTSPEGETTYTEGTWSTRPKEVSVEEETTVQDTKKNVPVAASGAALDVQASGTNSGWYILGAYIGTSNANTADCWADGRGVAFTNEKSYTSGNSTVYYEDIYVSGSSNNRSEIKLHNSSADPAWRNATTKYLNAYEWNGDFDYSTNYKIDNNSSINAAWYGNSGKFRAMFNTSTNKLSFRSLDLSIYGENVWTEENGTNSNWNIANAISLDTEASDTDYYTTVYIVNGSKFKFYAPTTTAYFGMNSTYNFSANETKKAPEKMGNSGASGSSFLWGGETGTYEVHYNPCTYEIWFKEIAKSFDITNNSPSIITIGSTANSTSTVNFTTTGPAKITAVDGDGNNVTILQTDANKYKFTMPSSDVTISATAVTAGNVNVKAVVAGGSGNVTGLSSTATLGTSITDSKAIGSKVTLSASANSGYTFSKWRVSGTYGEDYYLGSSTMTSNSIDVYPITNVTVKAVFVENTEALNMYVLYSTSDQFILHNTPLTSQVYKKAASSEPSSYQVGSTGYVWYTDISTTNGNYYFCLSGGNTLSSRYYKKEDASISDWSVTTSDSSLIKNIQNSKLSSNDTYDENYGYRSQFGVGSSVSKVRIYALANSSSATEPDGKKFLIVPNPSVVSENSVIVYAKNGTIRNADYWHSAKNDGTYNKYAALAETTIDYVNIEDGYMTENRDFNNLCQVETVEKGKTIRITTKINNANKNKYYVKAFCINGYSFGIIDEPKPTDTKRTSGVYTYDYKIPLDSPDKVEITPIYFYLTDSVSDNGDNKYITFYAEDFVTAVDGNGVKDKWGDTLSVYSWYGENNEKINNIKLDHDLNTVSALGGYPGQPMVYENGSYYMQVPVYNYIYNSVTGKTEKRYVKGITMNNYYWDDVHYTHGDLGALSMNCQTYDYDDFVALIAYDELEEIIFSFKYRSGRADDHGNSVVTDQTQNNYYLYARNATSNLGNEWNALVDYYDYAVDIFGNRITYTVEEDGKTVTKYYKESDVEDMITANETAYKAGSTLPNKNVVYVVSDGYRNSEKAYIGDYATKWYVYGRSLVDDSLVEARYIAALPPSAFIWNIPAEYADEDLPNDYLSGFLGYSDKSKAATSDRSRLWTEYLKLYNAKDANDNYLYRNQPVFITYESGLSEGTDYGHRNDGRWYFSRKNATISANVKIQIDNGDGTYTYDEISDKGHGRTTGANAFFTNNEFYGEIDSGTVTQSKTAYFAFLADGTSVGFESANDDTPAMYEFQGWYMSSGKNNNFLQINAPDKLYSVTGTRAMTSNATFIARYKKVDTSVLSTDATAKMLTITHDLYSKASGVTDAHSGTGSTTVSSVTITYSDSTTKTIENTSSSLIVMPENLTNATNVSITLTTVPATGSEMYDEFLKNGSTYESYKSAHNNTTPGTNVTYSYTIAELFPSGTQKKDLKYYADLSSTIITLNVKYYDRKMVNNSPATINEKERVLTFTFDRSGYSNLAAAITAKVPDIGAHIDNVIDEYVIWPSQKGAVDGIKNLPNLREEKTEGSEQTTSKNGKIYQMYQYTESYLNASWSYHTDCYTIPQSVSGCKTSDNQKWVTYTDSAGNEITPAVNNEVSYDTFENDDLARISTATIWAYNTPKKYTVNVYAPNYNAEAVEPEVPTTSIVIGTDTLYYNAAGTLVSTPQIGFYNQRLGTEDTTNNKANSSVGYLDSYGIEGSYLNHEIKAVDNIPAGTENEIEYKYVFDGWYASDLKDNTHKPTYKVSSNVLFGYRITTDLNMVACYKKVAIAAEANVSKGLTVSSNGVDGYALNGVNMVRFNTMLNIYGVDEPDKNIKQVGTVYVRFPATYKDASGVSHEFTDNESTVIANIASDLKSKIETENADDSMLASTGMKLIDVNDVTIGDGSRLASYIKYSYTVDWDGTATGSYVTKLTNKNRVQFVIASTVEDYSEGGRNSAIIVFGAMRYDDRVYETTTNETTGEETTTLKSGSDQWYLSDNYVSYITNK